MNIATKKETKKVKHSLADALPDIIDKLVELARSGNTDAAKLLLDRIWPPLRPQSLPVNIPIRKTFQDTGVVDDLVDDTDIGAMLAKALAEHKKKLIEAKNVE